MIFSNPLPPNFTLKPTAVFSVVEYDKNHKQRMSTLQPKHCKVHIDFIDDYVSSIVHSVLSSDPRFTILSSGSAYDSDSSASSSSSAPPPPPSATFSYADYENVHWSSVLSNKLSTCNFCVRKVSERSELKCIPFSLKKQQQFFAGNFTQSAALPLHIETRFQEPDVDLVIGCTKNDDN